MPHRATWIIDPYQPRSKILEGCPAPALALPRSRGRALRRSAVEADIAPQMAREIGRADRLDAIPPQVTLEVPAQRTSRRCLPGLREQDLPWTPVAIAPERGR